jgi:hypothetical protein
MGANWVWGFFLGGGLHLHVQLMGSRTSKCFDFQRLTNIIANLSKASLIQYGDVSRNCLKFTLLKL